MEKLLKNININDFKNYSLNPNLKVWNSTSDKPIQNIPEKNGNDIFEIAAHIKISFSNFNPYYKTSDIFELVGGKGNAYLSYHDCVVLFNDLHGFQTASNRICSLCSIEKGEIDYDILSQFIDASENWYYKEGDRLYPYLYFLLTEDFEKDVKTNKYVFKPLIYRTITSSFLDHFTNHFKNIGISIQIINNKPVRISKNIIDLEGYNDFINNYIFTIEKIGQIVDLIYNYILTELYNEISSVSSEYPDVYIDIKKECYNYVFKRSSDFFKGFFSCDTITITSNIFYDKYEGKYKFDPEPPKLKLPILLVGNVDDMGVYNSMGEQWVPGKRYYLNDIVIYDGQMYILKNVDKNGFAGDYNHIENVIYFDKHKRKKPEGYFDYFETSNFELIHWKLTTNNNCISHIIQSNTESLLYTLKGLIPDENKTNFFDVEGKYAKDIYRNISEKERKTNEVLSYASRITNISNIVYYDINNIIIPYADEKVIDGTIVRREIKYEYYINDIIKNTNNGGAVRVEPGIKYIDTISSTVFNAAGLEWNENTVTTNSEHAVYSIRYDDYEQKTEKPPVTPSPASTIHSNNEIWVNTPLIKEEYLFAINEGKPRVENNIRIERGIVYSQDKHMALGEIKTFTQMINYNNGSFWKIYDNTKRNEEELNTDDENYGEEME